MDEFVNRAAMIMRPKAPYLEWCRHDDAEGLADGVYEQMREEPHVALLPAFEDDADQKAVLEMCWARLFESMLVAWARDESLWPRKRTFAMFTEWIEFEIASVVIDFDLDEPLGYLE